MVHTGRVDRAELLQPAARIPVEGDDVLGAPIRRALSTDGNGVQRTACHSAAGIIVHTHHGPLRA